MGVTWRQSEGLYLYINGLPVGSAPSPRLSPSLPGGGKTDFNEFVIGRPNDNTRITDKRGMSVDEFHFWSTFKSAEEMRELGERMNP